MRIGDVNPSHVKPPDGDQRPERPAEEPAKAPPETSTETVHLSRLSKAIADAGTGQARLERLRLEVQSGTYSVPAAEVARKIVDFHKE